MQAQNLHVALSRGNVSSPILRGIDLEIPPGRSSGCGESGSGKSVLGLTMLGLLPEQSRPASAAPCSSTARSSGPRPRRRCATCAGTSLGAVFQDPMTSLDPTMRIGKQMLEVADSRAQVLSLLIRAGVPDAARRMKAYPHELSGGLRQRVMIALAIAGTPRLIVADEPTTALDVTVQAQILALFAGLRDELGCSIVFVTHDLAVAAQIADRIAVLYGGRLARSARPVSC